MNNKLLSVTLSRFQSFNEEGATISDPLRLNIFCGANNSGKSKLLAAVQRLTGDTDQRPHLIRETADAYTILYKYRMADSFFKNVFGGSSSGGHLGSNWWETAGQYLEEVVCTVGIDTRSKGPTLIDYDIRYKQSRPESIRAAVEMIIKQRPELLASPFKSDPSFIIAAERDIRPEGSSNAVRMLPNGLGITNAIRRNLLASTEDSSLVRVHMLRDLNLLMSPHYHFNEILVREHEHQGNAWEVHFVTETGSVVRLSQSGSRLKTVLCLLANVHLGLKARDQPVAEGLYIFEELENSLHPRLQRNIYQYIDERFVGDSVCLISTHSPVALDFYQSSSDASFYHVSQDEGHTECRRVVGLDERMGALDALGVRASDALLSNFVIWVEGPTDRMYLNHMLALLHGDQIREGRDYVIMFYGGRLLAHLTADAETKSDDLIRLLSLNPKCAMMIDSDRISATDDLNATKIRVAEEFRNAGRPVWITAGREIENYIAPEFLRRTFGASAAAIGQFDSVFDLARAAANASGKSLKSKLELAAIIETSAQASDFHLDWREQVEGIFNAIAKANS